MELRELPLVYEKDPAVNDGRVVYSIIQQWESLRGGQFLGTCNHIHFRSVTCPAFELEAEGTVYIRGADRNRDNQRLEMPAGYTADFETAVHLFNKSKLPDYQRELILISDVIRGPLSHSSGVRLVLQRIGTEDGNPVYRKVVCRLVQGGYNLGPLAIRACAGGCSPYIERTILWTNVNMPDERIPVRTSPQNWEEFKKRLLEFNQKYSNNKLEMDDVIWDE